MIGRLLSRWQRMGGPGFWWDDWTILFVWASSIQMIVILVLKSDDDAAWDSWAVTKDLRKVATLWVFSSAPSYFIGTFGAKVSLVLLYLRVVADNKTFRHVCWVTIFLCMAGLLGFTIGALATLWPLYYYEGDTAIPRQKLLGINFQITVFAIAACNIWLDFVVLLLPLGLLSRVRGISRQWKIWISAIFITGFAATAISIVRLVYIFPLRNSTNVSWDFGWFGMWSEVEVHVSTICANMPPMAGLLRRRWIKSHRRAASEDVSALNTGMVCVGASATTDSGSTQPAADDIEVSRAEAMRALEVGSLDRGGNDVSTDRSGGSFGTDTEKGRNFNNLPVVHEARDVMKER
ncbi:hypothetical protein CB0940_03981 [Cercospora beticola]|nr:hypothetical protein CB0940_03981 [Cercospora beticola]PIA93230.1 hypothetical protein CB0940_03981 [Cercospora beticola]